MSLGASAVEHQLAELLIQHERLQRSHNALLATMRSQTETYIQHTLENATCVVPDHPETPANATLLSAMCVVVTAIIIVTIAFEWLKEEWEKRMHQSLKAVVRNVFGKLIIWFSLYALSLLSPQTNILQPLLSNYIISSQGSSPFLDS